MTYRHPTITQSQSKYSQPDSVAPVSVKSRTNDPPSSYFSNIVRHSNARNADLLVELITTGKHCERINTKLSSIDGHFSEPEATEIIFDILEDIKVTKPKTDERGYVWATGVLAYFLLSGYPLLCGNNQVFFYNQCRIGPQVNSEGWENMIHEGHEFPSKKWKYISDDARQFVMNLTCKTKDAIPPLAEEAQSDWWICCGGCTGWIDFDEPFDDSEDTSLPLVEKRTYPLSEVTVRQHTRKKPKTRSQRIAVEKKVPLMKISTFQTILKNQQHHIDCFKTINSTNPVRLEEKQTWDCFWESAKKSKRKRKPKYVWESRKKDAVNKKKKMIKAINDLTKPLSMKVVDEAFAASRRCLESGYGEI
jgi:hypothetical protein